MFGWLKRLGGGAPSTYEAQIIQAGGVDAAMAEARETLPVFWRKFEAQDGELFQLKVGLTTPAGAVEHIWLEPSRRADDKIIGRLSNPPVDLEDVALGDEVTVDAARVSDWGYLKDGRLYGAYTQRALLGSMSPHTRCELEAVLAPTPLEADA